jgi:hypothetical protein
VLSESLCDERECIVDRRNTIACDFHAEQLRFLIVDHRRGHGDDDVAVGERRELDCKELKRLEKIKRPVGL